MVQLVRPRQKADECVCFAANGFFRRPSQYKKPLTVNQIIQRYPALSIANQTSGNTLSNHHLASSASFPHQTNIEWRGVGWRRPGRKLRKLLTFRYIFVNATEGYFSLSSTCNFSAPEKIFAPQNATSRSMPIRTDRPLSHAND